MDCGCSRPTTDLFLNVGLGSLVIETMTAVDDFESFTNFMDNAVADEDGDDDGCASEDEERKRSHSDDSGDRSSHSSADDARSRRK